MSNKIRIVYFFDEWNKETDVKYLKGYLNTYFKKYKPGIIYELIEYDTPIVFFESEKYDVLFFDWVG